LAITKPISAFFYGGIWLLGQDIYRTILPYFKKLSQHYNNIPEFMKELQHDQLYSPSVVLAPCKGERDP